MIETHTLNQPEDWNETSAPWPFTEDDAYEEDENIELPELPDEDTKE